MPRTFYLKDDIATGTLDAGAMQDGGTAPAEVLFSPETGWTMGENEGAGRGSDYIHATRRGLAALVAGVPAMAFDANQGFRTPAPLVGILPAGSHSVSFGVRASNATYNGRCRMHFRLWASTFPDPTAAQVRAVSSVLQTATTTVNITTTASVYNTEMALTFDPGQISLANEYLFLTLGIEQVTNNNATATTSQWILFKEGAGTQLTIPDLTPFPVLAGDTIGMICG